MMVRSFSKTEVIIELSSDIHLHVTRSVNVNDIAYLGLFVTRSNGIGDHVNGVIGEEDDIDQSVHLK